MGPCIFFTGMDLCKRDDECRRFRLFIQTFVDFLTQNGAIFDSNVRQHYPYSKNNFEGC